MSVLFAVQVVDKYREAIGFIRHALSPYRDSLGVLPNATPEIVTVTVEIARKDPPFIRSVECRGKELLIDIPEESDRGLRGMWRLSLKQFNTETLKTTLEEAWYVPAGQLRMDFIPSTPENVQLRLPKGKTIGRPSR